MSYNKRGLAKTTIARRTLGGPLAISPWALYAARSFTPSTTPSHRHALSRIVTHRHASSRIVTHRHASSRIVAHRHASSRIVTHRRASSRIVIDYWAPWNSYTGQTPRRRNNKKGEVQFPIKDESKTNYRAKQNGPSKTNCEDELQGDELPGEDEFPSKDKW